MNYYDSYNDTMNGEKAEFKRRRISSVVKSMPMTNAGGAILIVIFVVLCLTVFGFLSFSTAFVDRKLTDKSIKNTIEYYTADSAAEERVAKIYDFLWNLPREGRPPLNSSVVVNKLKENNLISEEELSYNEDEPTYGETLILDFSVPLNDISALFVSVEFGSVDFNGDIEYTINAWNVAITAEFDYSRKYNLFDEEDGFLP